MFGGIDTDKYHGDLARIQIYKDQQADNFTSFMVALTSVTAVSPSGTDALTSRELPIPVVLDSGCYTKAAQDVPPVLAVDQKAFRDDSSPPV